MTGDPLSDFLFGIATDLANDVLKTGAAYLRDMAFGDAEQRALQRVYQRGFYVMLCDIAGELDEMQQEHLGDLFREFVHVPDVTQLLIDTAIAGENAPLADLRTEFARHFDPDTLIFGDVHITFDAAIIALLSGLEDGIEEVASEPDSPLFNKVVVSWLKKQHDMLLEFASPAFFDGTVIARLSNAGRLGKTGSGQQPLLSTELVREVVQAFIESGGLDAFSSGRKGLAIATPKLDSAPRQPTIFASRMALVEELIQTLRDTTWLALVDALGRGKSQLARVIANRFENRNICWISLRDVETPLSHLNEQLRLWVLRLDEEDESQALLFQTSNITDSIEFIAGRIETQGILVIDDLPELLNTPQLLDVLLLLTDSFSNAGLKLVTTGQYDLPSIIKSDLDAHLIVRTSPDFTDHDVLEMLDSVHAPEHVRDERIISLILGTTNKHPSLVAQSIYWLKGRDWQIGEQEFLAFLSGDPTVDIRGDFRRRLSRLEEDEKELAYRLSLLWDKFDRVLALSVADISPSVDRPGEALDQLTGPWIECLLDDTYRVSPLIRDAGKDNLPAQIQHQVHQVVANHYLSGGTIDVSQAHTIALHFWCAKNYSTFAAFLIQLMSTAETSAQARYIDWALQIPTPGMEWPDGFSLDSRIMLRAMQVRTCALAGNDFSKLNDELEMLIAQARPDHRISVLFACLITGPMSEGLPAFSTLQRTIEAVRLIRDERLAAILPGLSGNLEESIWFAAIRLEALDEIIRFFEEVQMLTDTERVRMFNAEIASEASWHLLDKIWWTEAGKSVEERVWDTVFQVLDVAREVGMMQGSGPLLIAQGRARAVVLADYFSKRDDALQILQEIPEPDNPNLSFLIHFTMGCILYDAGRYSDALYELDRAYAEDGADFSYFRFDSRKRAVVCLSKLEQWHDAKNQCIKTIHLAGKGISPDVSVRLLAYDRLELMGELAWIHWVGGNRRKACAALYGVVTGLIECEDLTEPRFREVFNKTAHALGWYMTMARLGEMPTETLSGGVYKPVEAGLFAISRERIGLHELPGGFSGGSLLSHLEILTQSIGLFGIAWRAYNLAQAFIPETANFALTFAANVERAPVAAKYADPKEALQIGARAVKALSALEQLRNAGKVSTIIDLLSGSAPDTENIWVSTPAAKRIAAQQMLLYTLIGPVVVNILATDIHHPHLAQKSLRNWAAAVASDTKAFEDANLRGQVSRFFRVMAEIWEEGDLSAEELEFINSVPLFGFVWDLVRSSRVNLGFILCLQMHVIALISMTNPGSQSKYMLQGFGQFVHEFWLDVAHTRGFALSNPRGLRDEFGKISPRLGARTAAQVLRSAARSVGSRLSAELETRLQQIIQE